MKSINQLEIKTGWPSGLRRQIKALVSSGAWVRIPLQSIFFDFAKLRRTVAPYWPVAPGLKGTRYMSNIRELIGKRTQKIIFNRSKYHLTQINNSAFNRGTKTNRFKTTVRFKVMRRNLCQIVYQTAITWLSMHKRTRVVYQVDLSSIGQTTRV